MVFDTFLYPAMAHAAEQTTTYTLNWVHDRKGTIVLTNSSLPVIPSKGTAFPCHDSHKPVRCSAQMIGTQTSGTEQFSLRLTSDMFGGQIDIQVKFDLSFLDLFIGDATEVFFPLPIEKPIDCGMIMPDDMQGNIVLTNQSLPVVGITVIVRDIKMEDIKYEEPKDKDKLKSWLPKKSLTPVFDEKNDGTVLSCTLPDECLMTIPGHEDLVPVKCLMTIPCHEGLVPVKCLAKLVWSQTLGSQTLGSQTSVILLSSKSLKTPIYVQINHDPSFLDLFIRGEIQVFFPMHIPKKTYTVEIKSISNHRCLKEKSGSDKADIREKMQERRQRGEIGNDDDGPLPVKGYQKVQRPNQVWSSVSNDWELIRKPKPRNADWKWNDSTTSWVCCEYDPETNFLKDLDRTKFSNCWVSTEKQSNAS